MRKNFSLYPIFACAFVLDGCHSAPSQNILGSYFPSWLLCAVIGIILTVLFYILFLKMGVDKYIPGKLLVYPGLIISLTFFIWLIWFGN
ncbi:MAG: YtcA family lipoprotein [Legionellales bacterium]